MNEIELIVRQIDGEHRRLEELLAACSAASQKATAGGAIETDAGVYLDCAEYFLHVAGRAIARDRAHCQLLVSRTPPDDGDGQRLLEQLQRSVHSGQDALAALEQALQERRAGRLPPTDFVMRCGQCAQRIEAALRERPAGLRESLQKQYSVADWRRTGLVSADSILEERALHSRAWAKLAPRLRLAGGPTRE